MHRWASAMSSASSPTSVTDSWMDISSHNVGLPALSIKNPDCHGHLTKLGHRHKNWKRRYCVLKDACLYYYLEVYSTTAQGIFKIYFRKLSKVITWWFFLKWISYRQVLCNLNFIFTLLYFCISIRCSSSSWI